MTWWHWVDGNVTRDGIRKDLTAMRDAGIRGAILFDVGFKFPSGSVPFMGAEWQSSVQLATREAARLGMSLGAFNSPGYSQSGGPWIDPEQSMKHLVFTTTSTADESAGFIRLPQPKAQRGVYHDVAVIAYPTPSAPARLNGWDLKSGRKHILGSGRVARAIAATAPTPEPAPEGLVPVESIIVLRERLDGDLLHWALPHSGDWTLLRVGYTSTGAAIHPATPASVGLECDKMDRKVVRYHLESYIGRLKKLCDDVAPGTFQYVQSESWECGMQDWTGGLAEAFRTAEGYDILPYLPLILSGQVIGSAEESERVLWDWRRYLTNRIAHDYFGEIHRFCRDNGLIMIGENAGAQQFLCAELDFQRVCDIPMGEIHVTELMPDNRASASSAHTTGRRCVASETFTGKATLRTCPSSLQPKLDRAFCEGVNLAIFHTYVHQPWDIGPGITLGAWGTCLNRNNTWFTKAHGWFDYIRRCQFMLQKGRPVADLLVFAGNGSPASLGFRKDQPDPIPAGLDFDGCDGKALLAAHVENGSIVLEPGSRYRILMLPAQNRIELSMLRKIRELVEQGAVVVGSPPVGSPSWAEHGDDAEFRRLVEELWGLPVANGAARAVGKGLVFRGKVLKQALKRIDLVPDFESVPGVRYTHRQTDAAEIYFVVNDTDHAIAGNTFFRVRNRIPELWNPLNGQCRFVAGFERVENGIRLPLALAAHETSFVVFRSALATPPGGDGGTTRLAGNSPAPIPLDGPWRVSFPAGSGAPASIRFDRLVPLDERPEFDVQHFSGTAAYRKSFMLPESISSNSRFELDLGRVEVLADVRINGKQVASLWRPPFRTDITDAVIPGENNIEVHVTTLWVNRLIGDEFLPQDFEWGKPLWKRTPVKAWPGWLSGKTERTSGRKAFCAIQLFGENDPLVPSGLIGPVRILRQRASEQ